MTDAASMMAANARRPAMTEEVRAQQLAFIRSVSPGMSDDEIYRTMPWLRPPATEDNAGG